MNPGGGSARQNPLKGGDHNLAYYHVCKPGQNPLNLK